MPSSTYLPVLPSGYVTNVLVGGTNVSRYIDYTTLEIEQSGNQNVGTCRFSLVDPSNTVPITDKAFVRIFDNNGELFKGFVNSRTPRVRANGRNIDVLAHGIEGLLDTIIIVSWVRNNAAGGGGESDKQRIQAALNVFGSQGLYNNSIGSSDVSQIRTLRATMPNQKFKNMTLRQLIESVLGLASDSADYYIDADGRLHTFDTDHPEGLTAPYVMRVGTPGAGEAAPEGDMDIDFDSQSLINDYQVRAKNRTYDVRRADLDSINLYGRYAAFVDAPDADTQAKANAIGDAALSDNKSPKVRANFNVSSPKDLNGSAVWKTGQFVTLYSPQHGLTGQSSRIVSLRWRYMSGTGEREVSVQAGGDRLRLRSGGTQDSSGANQTSGATVTGDIG